MESIYIKKLGQELRIFGIGYLLFGKTEIGILITSLRL
jgi:hypothetical protein